MLGEILVALILGVLSGIFTGITPGIHVNLVSVLVLTFSPFLLRFTSPLVLGLYIISLAITHTFLDVLPSIYLGAPDESQALGALPGHRMLIQGQGHQAVVYTTLGSLGSLMLSTLLFPLFIVAMIAIAPLLESVIGYLLIILVVYMIAREKQKWLKSLVLFLIAGCLGLLVFAIPNLKQPLFPLLSGLFGFSLLLMSLLQKSKIPKQDFSAPLAISKKNIVKSVGAASGMGFIAAFLPGFGSSQAATIATTVVGDIGDEGFLSLVGGINTANMLISIATAYALDKSRNGAIVVVNELMQIDFQAMLVFIAVSLVVGGVATIITFRLSKIFATLIVKVNYQKLVWGIIVFITLLTFYFDGVLGLVILMTATAIGLVSSVWNIGKSHLMGCLIIPVILYFVL